MQDINMMKINGSPFYKKSYHEEYKHGDAQISKSVRIPKTLYNDLEEYRKGMGFEDFSAVVKNILIEKMESLNTFKRTCFNNIECIMLIPKTSTIKDLDAQSEIITLYNTDLDFFDSYYNHEEGFKKTPFNILYDLQSFDDDSFPTNILLMLNRSDAIFGIQQKDMLNWDALVNELEKKQKENLLNPDLNLRDCYFVRFPFNNYLDVKLEGQYQHSVLKEWHEGIYIFDEFGFRRLYLLFRWAFSDGLIRTNFHFIPQTEFMRIIQDADEGNLRKTYENLKHSDFDRAELDELIAENERHGEFLKRLRSKI